MRAETFLLLRLILGLCLLAGGMAAGFAGCGSREHQADLRSAEDNPDMRPRAPTVRRAGSGEPGAVPEPLGEAPAARRAEDETFEARYRESRFFRQHDLFLSADEPQLVPAAEASFLRRDDEVLGFVVDRHARAYPLTALAYHHVINDRIHGTPLAVTY